MRKRLTAGLASRPTRHARPVDPPLIWPARATTACWRGWRRASKEQGTVATWHKNRGRTLQIRPPASCPLSTSRPCPALGAPPCCSSHHQLQTRRGPLRNAPCGHIGATSSNRLAGARTAKTIDATEQPSSMHRRALSQQALPQHRPSRAPPTHAAPPLPLASQIIRSS